MSLTAALSLGCGEPAPERATIARPVKLLTLGSPGAGGSLEYPGVIRPVREADMAFEVPGRLIEFPVDEGQPVRAGTVLARLDPRDYQQQFGKAEAVLRKNRADAERFKHLYEEEVAPIAEYEVYQRNYEMSAAEWAIAKKALEDTVLRAPFDGIVARKLVEDFANVQAKEPVLVLQDDSKLEIRVNVPERDLTRRTHGETLEAVSARLSPHVVLSARPDRRFPAMLTELATAADPETRTYQATLTFDRPDDVSALPGMTAKVSIQNAQILQGRSPALRVPSVAVVGGPDGAFVWVVETDSMTVRKARVEVGPISGDQVEIRGGLEPGQTIALTGVHELSEGAPVRPSES